MAAARLGRRTTLVTKVGGDGLGRYVRNRLRDWGVDTRFVGVRPGAQTPVVLTALDPPASPQITFYRGEAAPDTTLTTGDLPEQVVTGCDLLWLSHASLAQGTTAAAVTAWARQRGRRPHTVLDLDYRPDLSVGPGPGSGGRTRRDRGVHRGGRQPCGVRDGARHA